MMPRLCSLADHFDPSSSWMQASQTVGLALAAILLLSMNGAQARKMLADPPAEAPTYGYNAGLASQDGGVRRRLQEDSMAPGPGESITQPPLDWKGICLVAAPCPVATRPPPLVLCCHAARSALPAH